MSVYLLYHNVMSRGWQPGPFMPSEEPRNCETCDKPKMGIGMGWMDQVSTNGEVV